jgi:hypothetical protein
VPAWNHDVPEHWQCSNLIAFTETKLARLALLEGCRDDAARLAEHAIEAMERAKVPAWMQREAWDVWERATS